MIDLDQDMYVEMSRFTFCAAHVPLNGASASESSTFSAVHFLIMKLIVVLNRRGSHADLVSLHSLKTPPFTEIIKECPFGSANQVA